MDKKLALAFAAMVGVVASPAAATPKDGVSPVEACVNDAINDINTRVAGDAIETVCAKASVTRDFNGRAWINSINFEAKIDQSGNYQIDSARYHLRGDKTTLQQDKALLNYMDDAFAENAEAALRAMDQLWVAKPVNVKTTFAADFDNAFGIEGRIPVSADELEVKKALAQAEAVAFQIDFDTSMGRTTGSTSPSKSR